MHSTITMDFSERLEVSYNIAHTWSVTAVIQATSQLY